MSKLLEFKAGELKQLREFQPSVKVSLAVIQSASKCAASCKVFHQTDLTPLFPHRHRTDTAGSHQVHLVGPLKVILHRPIIQANPGVVMAQT